METIHMEQVGDYSQIARRKCQEHVKIYLVLGTT